MRQKSIKSTDIGTDEMLPDMKGKFIMTKLRIKKKEEDLEKSGFCINKSKIPSHPVIAGVNSEWQWKRTIRLKILL